jgi:two-component system sensor histidine kinase BaeS
VLTLDQAGLLLPSGGADELQQSGSAEGTVEVRGEPFLYAARAVDGDAIVLLRSVRDQSADWTPFLLGLGLAGLVGATLAALVALALARAVARPVTRVAEASRRLAAGESPEPLRVEGPEEVRQLAAAFNELSEELRLAQDAERAFLLSVSHELKTPLTAIRGHAEGLSDGVVAADRAGGVIEREARRLERLIRDLLDLARLRRRSFSIVSQPVDLGEIALEAMSRYEPQSHAFGVGLDAAVEPGAGALADPDRTLQALSNLVENALRCTGSGGTVRIVASPGRLDVEDDGPGIAAGDLEQAFERFYLWDRYGADRPVGTGLGLAIVAELMQAMGGEVQVASEPGAGSTFTLLLPPAAPPPRPSSGETHYVRLTQR